LVSKLVEFIDFIKVTSWF